MVEGESYEYECIVCGETFEEFSPAAKHVGSHKARHFLNRRRDHVQG